MNKALVLVLHAHIPYVLGHGAWPHGEDWLYESVAESYLPLLKVFTELADSGHLPKVTVVITPILAEQLCDARFRQQFKEYLISKKNAAQEDESYFVAESDMHMAGLARTWQEYYARLIREFTEVRNEDVVGAFRSLEQRGAIEVMTCAATHGYLPLLGEDSCVSAQIKVAMETHKRRFGVAPRGLWLPECAYQPRQEWTYPIEGWGEPRLRRGLDEFLADEGIRYFVVDSHLVQGGEPVTTYHRRFGEVADERAGIAAASRRSQGPMRSPYDVYYIIPHEGEPRVAFFTRDPKTGIQVWSGTSGYPGDGNYLEFHKRRFPGGHRYWRITDCKGSLDEKLPYLPDEAQATVRKHAAHFIGLIDETIHQPGVSVVTAPYDAELFGHWWFEGPNWLKEVLQLARNHPEIKLTTPTEFLEVRKPVDVVQLPEGSWGLGGAHAVWFNSDTRWTWLRIYDAEMKMKELVQDAATREDTNVQALLKQIARELLLLESSDWQFNITTWSARDYAERRLEEHYSAFQELHRVARDYLKTGALSGKDADTLSCFEEQDSPFEVVKPEWWL